MDSATAAIDVRPRTTSPKAEYTPMVATAISATTMMYSVIPWPTIRRRRVW
ncbi:MAG: hypothetical protein ACKOBU_00060 [Gammaproteobacteria bacterium]